jgi:hypothetical protein
MNNDVDHDYDHDYGVDTGGSTAGRTETVPRDHPYSNPDTTSRWLAGKIAMHANVLQGAYVTQGGFLSTAQPCSPLACLLGPPGTSLARRSLSFAVRTGEGGDQRIRPRNLRPHRALQLRRLSAPLACNQSRWGSCAAAALPVQALSRGSCLQERWRLRRISSHSK